MSSTTTNSVASSEECTEHNDSSNKEIHDNSMSTRNIDGGWAWIVLFFNVITAILAAGQYFNSGLYFYIFLNTFGESRSTTMWITASQTAANGLAGVLASSLIVNHGNRKTMILGSIIMGTSYGMMFFANSVPYAIVCFTAAGVGSVFIIITYITSLGLYFNKKLSIATGLVLAGSGIGTAIIGLEIEWAVATFGWRGSMLIQSGLIFQICVCAATIYEKVPSKKQTSSKKPQKCENNVTATDKVDDQKLKESQTPTITYTFLSDVRFWLLLTGFTFYNASTVIIFQIFKDFIVSNGFSFQYSVVMICNGVANCIGRICGGIMASSMNPILLTCHSAILCALAISMLLYTSFEWVVLVTIALFGFTNGFQGAPHAITCVSVFGKDSMALIYGYSMVAGVIPTLVLSPLAGYIVDETGSFVPVMLLSSVCMFFTGLSFLLIHRMHKRKSGIHSFEHNFNVSGDKPFHIR